MIRYFHGFENIDDLRKVRSKTKIATYEWNIIPADDAPEVISQKVKDICIKSDQKLL